MAVEFWHEGCSWCMKVDPLFQQLAQEYRGKMRFARLHVLHERSVADRYGLLATPVIKFFCSGREVYEVVGFRPLDVLRQELEKVLSTYRECLNSTTPLAGELEPP